MALRVLLAVLVLFVFLWTRGTTTVLPAGEPAMNQRWMEPKEVHAGPQRDLYGNEVSKAMGDYRIDGRGNLYERHAPDTAMLKLSPPST